MEVPAHVGRLRVCGAILRDDHILMVQHRDEERTYWTLPGGGVEANETAPQAVVREVWEETGLRATVVRHLFSEPYSAGICECYLLTVSNDQQATLGYDPEESGLEIGDRLLQGVAWQPIAIMQGDGQVAQVLLALANRLKLYQPVLSPPT